MTSRVQSVARDVRELLADLPYSICFRDIELSMPDEVDRDEILEAVEVLIDIGLIAAANGELELTPRGRDWDGVFPEWMKG